jgi:Tfp pilus assembly protein FimV
VRTGRWGDPNAVTDVSTAPIEAIAPSTGAPAPATAPPAGPARTPTAAKPKPSSESTTESTPESTTAPTHAAPAPSTTSPPAPATTPTPGTAYTVAPGDSFWEIAARTVAGSSGRDRSSLAAADIHSYWVRLCDANRARVRSGDVDLIYPGEVVDLPT